MTGPWPAPRATRPVDATVALPGSKSMTNRALVLAALADGRSLVRGPLRSRDTLLMADALRAMGVSVEDVADGAWQVLPGRLRGPAKVHCGLAGTVMRFVPPVAALATGTVALDGDPRARERPMRPVLDALRALGADLEDADGGLPMTVHGRGGLAGGSVRIDASASSQFVSGLLLAAPRYADGLEVHHVGPPVPSQPHLHMTLDMLTAAGVTAEASTPDRWVVRPGRVAPRTWDVEPDLSGAAPFLAAALVTGGRVTVPRWPDRTTQAGAALADLLPRMGADVTRADGRLTVQGTGAVRGVEADLRDVGELTPVLAAVAALADGPSRLVGVAHLRGHETDRIAALATELGRLGAAVTETADGLEIEPRTLSGATFRTYDDHRMAMAGAVLGLAVDGVVLDDVATTAKTLPDFPAMWARMLEPVR